MLIAPVWTDNLPLILAVVAAVLYYRGGRQRLLLITPAGAVPARSTRRRWQAIGFYSALVIAVFSLQPPMDGWADSLFWVHMIQHQLLLMIVAPLLIISAPWIRLWSGFPLGFRRPVARAVVQGEWARPLRRVATVLGGPVVAWILFNGVIIGWHVPVLYDAAVQNQVVHDVEHVSFLVGGVLFWGQLFNSAPFHSRLTFIRRFFYLASAMFPSWVLALIMVFSGAPLYPAYEIVESGHSGIGVMADQQIAGAIMWMLGSIPMAITGFCMIYQWAAEADESGQRRRRVARFGIAGDAAEH
jgi:putative membrane protein